MYVNVAGNNVNGLNCRRKQSEIVNLVNQYKIDVFCIQKHNVKEIEKLDLLK